VAAAEPARLNRRTLVAGGLATLAAGPALAGVEPGGFTYDARLSQGGFLIGKAEPRATLLVDGKVVGRASAEGFFVVGFDRDAGPSARIDVQRAGGEAGLDFVIQPVRYTIQRIDGLPRTRWRPAIRRSWNASPARRR
jgi:hypothetical protein